MKLPNKDSRSVMKAFEKLSEEFGEYFNSVFKSVTTDNGSEFSSLSELEKLSETLVYFAHPYTWHQRKSQRSFSQIHSQR